MPKIIVLHTSESGKGTGRAVAAYLRRNSIESHEVFDPASGECIQLLTDSAPGKALANKRGGVETNKRPGVYQIEIVGRAAEVPGYSDDWFKTLAKHLLIVAERTGTPLVFPCQFLPYPSSYGPSPVRLSHKQWLEASGIIGHQHVPENSHGDPGDISRVIPFTLTQPTQPKGKGPSMFCIHDLKDNTVYLWNGSEMRSFGGHPLLYQLHVNAGVPTVTVDDIAPIRAALGV